MDQSKLRLIMMIIIYIDSLQQFLFIQMMSLLKICLNEYFFIIINTLR
jgi:hypothetical protein